MTVSCVVFWYNSDVICASTHWGRNGRHFADAIFKCIFVNENVWISIKISLKFIPKGPINNIPALVQIMAWGRVGDKPLSAPMMVSLLMHICITRPQWVKASVIIGKLYCLLISMFMRTKKKPWKLAVTCGFSSQKANDGRSISMTRHHNVTPSHTPASIKKLESSVWVFWHFPLCTKTFPLCTKCDKGFLLKLQPPCWLCGWVHLMWWWQGDDSTWVCNISHRNKTSTSKVQSSVVRTESIESDFYWIIIKHTTIT